MQAAAEIAAATGVPISVHCIGRGTGGPTDPYGEWADRSEVDRDGAVLVRPDRHVAWRSDQLPPDPAGALTAVLQQVLGTAVLETAS